MTTISLNNSSWQEDFLSLLPHIKRQALAQLGYLDPESRDDAVSEVMASTCCAFHRLHQRGERSRAFPSALTRYAICRFFAGRRCGVRQSSRDVLAETARRKRNFGVTHLGVPREDAANWREQLTDNRSTPVPDQAAFRIDFPLWLASHSKRDREIAERMASGCSTSEIASDFGISSARVSQLRREFSKSWTEFHGEPAPSNTAKRCW
ncbi:helix-turn-helix transcriptional regulator [Rhodopirellula bahusiensis]|uniref:helix-turn-helix transcriptional regulator n=2 Tax=Rhodopirellula bahusiensis TaxID=2014065 RepID=UPI003265C23C